MGFAMPRAFPETEFQAFAIAANDFPPKFPSLEYLSAQMNPETATPVQLDRLKKKQHLEGALQAVRYRYRLCTECSEEFKALLASPSQMWQARTGDEELMYKLERCIYVFFMSGLSVFESFAFCLYFLGGIIRPDAFPHVSKPKKITLETTSKAFTAAFPQAAITACLAELSQKPEFGTLEDLRNVLAHRVSGRRNVRGRGEVRDGTYTYEQEETWHLSSSDEKLLFDEGLIQRHLNEINSLLTPLIVAAREFAENNRPKE